MTRFVSNRGNGTSVAQPKALSVLEGKGADADKILVESDILAAAGVPSDDSVSATPVHVPGTRPDHVPGLPPVTEADTTTSFTGTASHELGTQTTMAPAPLAANTITGTMDDDVLGDPNATTAVTISGGDGNDTLYGSRAADLLKGDADYDYLVGGAGNDTMDGGDGDYDLVSYAEETGGGGVVVNVSDAAWTFGTATYQSRTGTDTWGSLDTYLNIEAVTGSAKADVIYAGNSASGWIIDGGDGNDTLTGGGNDDELIGGAGDDTLVNGQVVYLGTQAINANLITKHVSGQGEDTLSNVTWLVGSEGNDTIYGANVASTIDGSLGNDVLYAGAGTTILANWGNDTVHGGMANQGSTNRITGNASTVLTYEDLGPNYSIKAQLGDNWIDEYNGGARVASDTLFSQIRTLIGSNGNDTIFGNSYANTLVGGNGNDYISGFGGGDSLVGGDGNDTLEGSYAYRDTLVGGLGDDYYILSVDTTDVLVDAGGNDTIEVMSASYTLGADFENLINTETGGATLIGNSSNNKLTSSWGNDTLDGAGGADTMIGGDGDDVYYIRDLGDVAIELNTKYSGNDTVIISVKNYDGTKLANIEHIQFVGEGSILGSNTAPVIGGLGSPVNLSVDDNQVVNPFSSVTITDTDSATVTAVVTLDNSYGILTNLGIGSYDAQLRHYTVTGTAAQVQDALRGLVFDPTDRPNDAVGTTQTTGFTITVTDAEGAGATPNSNVSVTSTTVNRAPWISYAPHSFTTYDTENTNLVKPFGYVAMNELNANDVLTVKIMLDAAGKGALVPMNGGIYDATTGIFTFVGTLQDARNAVASLMFNPTDRPNAAAGTVEATSFSITITDSSGATASVTDVATVNSVAVGHVNQAPNAPVFAGGNITDKAVAGALVGTLSASDPDGDPLTLTFDSAQANSNGLISADGRFKIVNGTIVVNNPQWLQVDKNETFTYTVTASDGHGGAVSSNISINVADVNHVPTAPAFQGGTVSETATAHTVVGTLSATDVDNDPLNYTFVNALGGTNGLVSGDGRFEIVNGTIQVRDPGRIQVDKDTTFNYGVYVTDGYSTKVMSTVAITVTNVNQAPVDLKLSNTVVQEHTAVGQTIAIVNANDPDQNGLTYTLLDDGGGRVELVNNELRVKSNTKIDYEQATSFQVKLAASDGTTSIAKTFTLTVTDVNPENVTGTAAADLIRGGSGFDTLSGGAGNDTLAGGAGDDRLTGGLGSDVFLFDTDPAKAGADTILDFSTKDNDHIYLARSAFKGFGAFDIGTLQTKAFVLGTIAMDADDRIMYDQASGKVFYDADGNGAGSAVLVATLATKPILTASAFLII